MPVILPGTNPSLSSQITNIGDYIYARLQPKYGPATANSIKQSWLNYAENHLNNTTNVDQLYLAWFLTTGNLTQNLANDIGQAPTAAAGGANALTKGLPYLSPVNDVLGGLNLGNVAERVGILLLGIVLVGVGIAKATGADQFNLISQAKKVIK